MRDPAQLFEDVVARTHLAAWIGPGAVRRALQSVGVASSSAALPDDYRRALPQLKARMALYLKPDEVSRAVHEIETLLK